MNHHLPESERALQAAIAFNGSIEKANYWFKNSRLPVFGNKTPQELVAEGQTNELIRYIRSLQVRSC